MLIEHDTRVAWDDYGYKVPGMLAFYVRVPQYDHLINRQIVEDYDY